MSDEVELPDRPTCRVCGCDEAHACLTRTDVACHWIDPTLCSSAACQLIDIGRKLRTEQKAYFKTRDQAHLIKSKQLEKSFDHLIAEGSLEL